MHVELAAEFVALWECSDSPPDVFAFFHRHSDASSSDKLQVLLQDQEQRWQTDQPLQVEDYLLRLPELAADSELKLQLAVGEFQARQNSETTPDIDEFTYRFSDLGELLKSKLLELASDRRKAHSASPFTATLTNNPNATQDHPAAGFVLTHTYNPRETKDPPGGLTNTQRHVPQVTIGDQRIGRYQLIRLLGQGGFGKVWLGFDGELQRQVAIKVPTPERFRGPEDAEAYLDEARTVASLDHPNIVPVHDVGRTTDGSIYVVSKFIEGCNLAERIQRDRPTCAVAATLLATVAQALHHAHLKRLIHRDVKPANILLEENTGTPYVADFGLAISEEDYLREGKLAGTPAYMSPEQARGEGHRLDGRSDIFSTGVMLYELLTGTRPFRGTTSNELLHQVITVDPAPPRDLDNSIPAELERICLKALSKRASDRYSTAAELADDLSHWQKGQQPSTQELQIVPKGLRSFDAEDANFFLDLLPGPRNRDGLPESIQFWKTRLEETDPDQTFSVGLIYGPSGCGKSSLVKAGLLPRLSKDVIAVYVEATPEETEIRILRGLRKRLPDLPPDLGLAATFAALRRREGQKVVVVLDQFEQWLHAHQAEQDAELVNALRQCDGGRVQAVVMVRDDFSMAASRFMRELDIRIVEGHNFATVDLFDIDHAQKVLAKFGQAFGKLPAQLSGLSDSEKQFLSSVAAGLAQDGKVVSVRLALFAEMVKGKSWIPATLEQVGGTTGIGVNFLDETFSSRSANPQHRLHHQAARGVLKALLPEVGTDIKGHMRSHAELCGASGYQGSPSGFNDLLRILDGELRLITPTDPAGFQTDSGSDDNSNYYQLTHDYLVPALREWLTRKQRETRKGRAELKLAERSALWNAKPENQQLPSLGEFLSIRLLTDRQHWTDPQRKLMGRAGRVQGLRSAIVATVLIIASVTGLSVLNAVVEKHNATRAEGLVDGLVNADIGQVPALVGSLEGYRTWADPLLKNQLVDSKEDSAQRLHLALALLPVDAGQVKYLYSRFLDATPHELPVIRDALVPHKDELVGKLWAVMETPEKGRESQRLRAASALAKYDPVSPRWGTAGAFVTNDLVLENPVFLSQWSEAFRPVRNWLLPRLSEIFRDHQPERTAERSLATNLLSDYAGDQPQVLADLLMDADEKQFAVLYPLLAKQRERGLPVLTGEIDRKLLSDTKDDAKEKLAKRQANAAVALLRLNQPTKVWPLLLHSPDPRVRSYLIHRFAPLGVDAETIVKRLEEELDVTIQRALILSLGEFGEAQLPLDARNVLLPKLQEMYQTAGDPGLHAAAEWLLRTWKQEAWLKQMNDEWAQDKEGREKKIAGIKNTLATETEKTPPQWYVNGQGQTMVVIPGPVEFLMGSPTTELGRNESETPHKQRIGRTFALAAKSVTKEQFLRFLPKFGHIEMKRYPDPTCPIGGVRWYEAAAYCNWLSKEEEIAEDQWCYETDTKGQVTKLKAGYLGLTGYRLPTEAEMEYATRAGAMTSRYFGETEDLLPKYAWYFKNSQERTWPVGSLKPNDLGLFDVQGNVLTWCQESYRSYPPGNGGLAVEDQEDGLVIVGTTSRVLRGGSFIHLASYVRSASRSSYVPPNRDFSYGFRAARTLLPSPLTSLPLTPEGRRNLRELNVSPATSAATATQSVVTPASPIKPIGPQPPSAKAPFNTPEAKAHQAAWAKHLGTQVETKNSVGMKLVLIPPGEFLMGSSDRPDGSDEHPQHRIVITKPFLMGATEVTVGQFKTFSATGYQTEAEKAKELIIYVRPGYPVTDEYPAAFISWNDAVAYCNWLSEQEKATYRLPTEAEWEYACRAGTTTQYSFGDDVNQLEQFGWYRTNTGNRSNAVGTKRPNAFGLHDMHGNLYEWCRDYWDAKWYDKTLPDDPNGPAFGFYRVIRGGHWDYSDSSCRSASRNFSSPSIRDYRHGFRCVRVW